MALTFKARCLCEWVDISNGIVKAAFMPPFNMADHDKQPAPILINVPTVAFLGSGNHISSTFSRHSRTAKEAKMSLGTIVLIILVILLLGGFSGFGGGPFYGTGHYGGIGLGTVLVIVLILVLLGRF